MSLLVVFLIIILIAIGFVLVVGILLSFKLTHRSYLKEIGNPAETGLGFNNVSFSARDGVKLRGWYIPASKSTNTIIQLHGHSGSMDPDIHFASDFHKAGFNVLMFDFRAHGRSEGKICTFGYLERYDVLGAIDYVKSLNASWIALVGFSMGGMAAILTAPLTPDVNAVISDGSPARIRTAIKVWARNKRIPFWCAGLLADMAMLGASIRVGVDLSLYEPVHWVQRIAPIPLLLIHGEADEFCPDFNEMEAQAKGAEIWREPDLGHVQISHELPDQYKLRVIKFLQKNLSE